VTDNDGTPVIVVSTEVKSSCTLGNIIADICAVAFVLIVLVWLFA
jgi:hypothetical protein